VADTGSDFDDEDEDDDDEFMREFRAKRLAGNYMALDFIVEFVFLMHSTTFRTEKCTCRVH
jgi:hypothetical protein